MNRRVYSAIFAAVVCLAFGLLTGCSSSSSSSKTVVITASGGTPQTGVAVGANFAALSATVTTGGTPTSGASVTFTAPSTGASCTFSGGGATETDTTNSSGVATSSACTANSTAGAFTVTASTTGASSNASFSLTSVASVTSANFVFYASGQDTFGGAGFLNYYAVAGALTIDSNGNVLAGEEDYNDASGALGSSEPATADTITPANGALVVDATTGTGTLTITSSNTNVGVGGQQIFAVQFVNPNHALITEFDGFATSSGSLDLQTATAVTAPTFAFAMSGIDNTTTAYFSWAFGGVFATSTGAGFMDINDGGTVSTGNAFTSTSGTPDAFGRNVVSVSSPAINLATYPVGPSVMRMIDLDTTDTAVGSAYGQGSGTFDNTSLTAGVFAEIGQWSTQFATVGQFTTDQAGNITSAVVDDNDQDFGPPVVGSDISANLNTYNLVGTLANGYGSMTLVGDGDVSLVGVYMVDPTLNINDPNNTTDLGGALIVDLDSGLPGGIGVITPQTDTTATNFNGNYAAGFQNINQFITGACVPFCEFDMNGQFTVASGALASGADGASDSDPFGTLTGTPGESVGDVYGPTTPLAGGAGAVAGYFSMSSSNTTANPLTATINGTSGGFNVDIYQASATTLYWIDVDTLSVWVGPIEQQSGTLAKVRGARKLAPRPKRTATKTFKNPH